MHRMLNPNPKERITVPEIMAHPWFVTDLPAGVTELNETLLATAAAAEVDDYDASCYGSEQVGPPHRLRPLRCREHMQCCERVLCCDRSERMQCCERVLCRRRLQSGARGR